MTTVEELRFAVKGGGKVSALLAARLGESRVLQGLKPTLFQGVFGTAPGQAGTGSAVPS